jgi:hypothetical protein
VFTERIALACAFVFALVPASAFSAESPVALGEVFNTCNASDVGSDSLWKYPSVWTGSASFIPPHGVCKTAKVGNTYKVLRNNVAGIAMCTNALCTDHLRFDAGYLGEFCVWRISKANWEKHFGGKSFDVVIQLKDKRRLVWNLVDPLARNGAPHYTNLKHVVKPACYTVKNSGGNLSSFNSLFK